MFCVVKKQQKNKLVIVHGCFQLSREKEIMSVSYYKNRKMTGEEVKK